MVGLVAVAIDQILRGQAVLSEWWVDLPLAALVAALFVHATQRRRQPPGPRPLDAIGEVMHAVSRGRHVDDVLESLTRQACRIIDVERAVVVVRDDTDPRLATVIAGHGVPGGDRLPGQFASQPGGATEDQKVHVRCGLRARPARGDRARHSCCPTRSAATRPPVARGSAASQRPAGCRAG